MNLNLDRSMWERVRFGDVVSQRKESVDPLDGTIDRYVAGEHMDSDDLVIHRWGNVHDGYLGPAFHRRFHAGQVLYGSRRTYLKKVAVPEFDGVCANTTFVLETKDPSRLLQRFLPFLMSSEPFHAFAIQESKGSVNPYVNFSDLAKFEFDLPPLDEQYRIADLLWAERRSRADLGALRDRLGEARAVLVEQSLANVTERWEFASIWSRSPESGWSAPPVDGETGAFVLALSALTDGGYCRGGLKAVEPTEEVRRARLTAGDLLISRANTIDAVGRAGIFDEERNDVSFPDTMMRLHVDTTIASDRYVLEVLRSKIGRAHVRRTAAGTNSSMLKINRQSLGKLPVPAMRRDAQNELLGQLEKFDNWLDLQQLALDSSARLSRTIVREVWP